MPRRFAYVAACLLASAVPASAQPSAPADTRAVVTAAREVLGKRYVLPATAAKLAEVLAKAEAAGRYRGLSGEALADRMSADLDAVAHDKHLGIRYDPRLSAQLRERRPKGEGSGVSSGYARQVEVANAGVRKLELLPGNIRYLAYDGFYWGSPGAEEALATAMRFLKEGDAIIIDIRRNGGGWPPAVAAMTSYFVPVGTPLVRFEMRGAPGEASKTPTAPFSLAGKPVFVLASGDTASAAEEFAAHVSAFGFGKLVGAPTAGAAYRNEFVPLPGDYVLSVSVGRPVHAKTGGDWEGKGVPPTIAVAPEQALLRAQAEAMAAVVARSSEAERAADTRLLAFYQALAAPVTPALPLARYAGRYQDRTVEIGPEGLTYRREGRALTRLVALGSDRFALEADPLAQVRFLVEGASASAIEVDRGDGEPNRLARTERQPTGGSSSSVPILNHMVDDPLNATFTALADPTRRGMLAALTLGEKPVSELAAPYRMSLAGAAKHVGVLARAGLIERRKVGRQQLCRLKGDRLKEASDWLAQWERFWTDRLDALESALKKEEK
ncbi:MAG TPA: metalloregulator ArsR/SmtB family transcription factor [Sphingomonadaceae bacterium]|nr:metalloregulator ArsR/SmtB family transcription factor [Sphingomonadaceae bacterium]